MPVPSPLAQITLRPLDWYAERRIELLLGQRAVRLDSSAHAVELEQGEVLEYDRLLLATGSSVRRFRAIEDGPVPCYYLRTLSDASNLRRQLIPKRRIVLLGGAIARGCDVSVVELAPRIMSRAVNCDVSDYLEQYHRSKGVRILLSSQAMSQAKEGSPGLLMKNGTVLPADAVVIGIGVVPNTELAVSGRLHCDDGIIVDEFGLTSDPDIFASGDAVRYPDAFFGRRVRSENWMHAQNQSVVVAKNMLGGHEPYRQLPSMWSDQYDLKIQTSGYCETSETVTRGDRTRNKFMLVHVADGRLVGATGINMARDMRHTQRLIESRARIDTDRLSDPALNLSKLSVE
jgi:NADPH-dependent 2,4-dienoyl-CoA reductase/sulfur reductase-like enzyme